MNADGEKNMDLKNLMTFIHVAELNSFTRAGQKLGFSQSTVSFQIRQLEKELGTQLFERINHTVVLTEKGRRGTELRPPGQQAYPGAGQQPEKPGMEYPGRSALPWQIPSATVC